MYADRAASSFKDEAQTSSSVDERVRTVPLVAYPDGMSGAMVVLRPMAPVDVPDVLAVQEPGAVVGLAKVFPQDKFPFPYDAVATRWHEEIRTDGIDCLVVEQDQRVIGFGAIRGAEFLHFGIALEHWGSGAAKVAHDAILDHMRAAGVVTAWLRVFTGNDRGRRFYEREGGRATGQRTRSTFPPYAELMRYELNLRDDR